MADILEELKQNQILHGKSVVALRNYIHQKYPDDHIDLKTKIFADAVNKIIDNNISHFDELIKIKIKKNLFKQIAKKEIFTINAYEVFEACTHINVQDQNFLNGLTAWINQNQSETIIREEVVSLTLELRESFTHRPVITAIDASVEELNVTLPIEPSIEITSIADYDVPRLSLAGIQLPEIPPTPIMPEVSLLTKISEFTFGISHSLKWLQRHYKNVLIAIAILIGLSVSIYRLLPGEEQYTLPTSNAAGLTITSDRFLDLSPVAPSDLTIKRTLTYQEVNSENLKKWLVNKNSLLAQEPYFTSIVNAAKEYDVNPLLLFAITGQEQAFVPNTNAKASLIANNPFNVYGSWEAYNTTIDESSQIAAKTIVNLRKDCPENIDIIKWINRKYAEDPNWHIGVSKIFAKLNEAMDENIE